MKKFAFRAFLAGLALMAFTLVLNRLDTKRTPAAFTTDDIPLPSLSADNGAYWLLFLGESEEEGLAIENKIELYREWLSGLERVERLSWQVPPKTRSLGGRYWESLRVITFPSLPDLDWAGFILSEEERLRALRIRLSVLMDRYEKMLASETVADFGYDREWDRPYALFTFVTSTARFYTALQVLDGREGRWKDAVGNLLKELRFAERLAEAGQSVFFYTIGRSLVDIALEGMAGILNARGCPDEARRTILAALPPLSPGRFSARNALIGDYLWVSERVEKGDRWRQSELALREIVPGRKGDRVRLAADILLGRQLGLDRYMVARGVAFELFLMKNRTLGYFLEGLEWLLALDAAPPSEWTAIDLPPPSFKKIGLPWLMNPSGKLLYKSVDPAYQKRTVERKFRTRVLYDLIRIAAEMQLLRADAESSGKWLERVASYSATDPFTGRPYTWDPVNGRLSSAGPNGKEEERTDSDAGRGDDITVPVRLY